MTHYSTKNVERAWAKIGRCIVCLHDIQLVIPTSGGVSILFKHADSSYMVPGVSAEDVFDELKKAYGAADTRENTNG